MDYIFIESNSEIPKYRQIVDSVVNAIANGVLKRGDKIPSLNDIVKQYNLSRDTVLAAFKELKDRKIISSTPGKGYYIQTSNSARREKVFMLFDEFNAFKEDLYYAFIDAVGKKAEVDLFFHHFNRKVFQSLIDENRLDYTSFVILPGSVQNLAPILRKLPFDRTFILDRRIGEIEKFYGCIYQDFGQDFYDALNQGQMYLMKYNKLIMVSPKGKEPEERKAGFTRFCSENSFQCEIIENLDNRSITEGEAYFLTDDRHLVQIIKQVDKKKLKLGRNVGVVSFNETMLKEVVAGGITTISTDFINMGNQLAEMVLNRKKDLIANPSKLIVRNSL